MNNMMKKVYRDIFHNKTKTLLILLSLLVGSLTVGIVCMISTFFVSQVNQAYQDSEPYHIKLGTDNYTSYILSGIRELENIKNVEGGKSVFARFFCNDKSYTGNLNLLRKDNLINIIRKQDGTDGLPELKRDEIFLERACISDLNKKPGDTIEVVIKGDKKYTFTISEIIYDAVTEPYMLEGGITAYINSETMEGLTGNKLLDQIYITIDGNLKSIERNKKIAKNVTDYLKTKGIGVNEFDVPTPGEFYATESLEGVTLIMIILGSLSVVLGTSLIINIINSIMLQHIKQIGIMKTIGGTFRQITLMYVGMISLIGIVTMIISLPLSAFLGYKICELLAYMFNIDLGGIQISIQFILAQVACTLILPILTAIKPIMKGTRTTVYNALNDNVKGMTFKNNKVLGLIFQKHKYVSTKLLISVRNVFRSKTRVFLTVITLALSNAIFLVGLNLQQGFDRAIVDASSFIPDIVISLNSFEDAKQLEKIIEKIDGVNKVEAWSFSQGFYTIEDESVFQKVRLMGAKPGSQILNKEYCEKKLVAGRWIQDESSNEIVVSNQFTKLFPDIKLDDILRIKIKGKIQEFKVVGMISLFGQTQEPLLYAGYSYMNDMGKGKDQVNDIRVDTIEDKGKYQLSVANRIEKALNDKGILVSEVSTGSAMLENYRVPSQMVVVLLMFLSIMIIIVGTIGLSGTLCLNVLERAREIGIMRVVGGINKKLNKIIFIEGLFIMLVAGFIGIIISCILTVVCNSLLGKMFFSAPLGFQINILGIILWCIISTIATYLASRVPFKKMNKMVTREILVYE